MSTYEARQEGRRELYLDRADKARREANQRGNAALSLSQAMNGQPILIGHHSEKRHRRDLQRMDDNMHKAAELSRKAEHYDQKAAGVGKAGISSDDPEAVQKLKDKLTGLQQYQEDMKRVNKQHRAGGWDAVTGLKPETIETCRRAMAATPWEKKPFPTYATSNNNANIRRIKERIAQLERTVIAKPPIQGQGFTVTEHPEDNRIWFEFDERPSRETCKLMRRNGWKWSRDRLAWVRHLNGNGRYSATYTAEQLQAA